LTDITARLPAGLSERIESVSSQITSRGGRAIDHAIGGIPFLSAASKELPFVYETAEMRREQQDNEREPGEQSLSGWWIRSQDSWHQGAGAKFQESRSEAVASARYFDSQGVDVWTEGELKLLKRMVQATPASTEALCVWTVDNDLYLGVGDSVKKTTIADSGAVSNLHSAAGETFTDVVAGSERWYGVTQQEIVYSGLTAGGGVVNWPLTNADPAVTVAPQLLWAKFRLWAVSGRHVFVVNTADPSATAQAAKYSHPAIDWHYTSIAEGPNCVYLAGYSGMESGVQKITLDTTGDVPTLTAGVTTATLPAGERVQRIAVLAGQWLCMVTSRGVRLAAIGAEGELQYGPLLVEPTNVVEGAAIASWGRWFWVSLRTSDGQCKTYRVDTAQVFDDGTAAYAADVEIAVTGYVTDLAVSAGRVVAAVSSGAYPSEAPVKYYYSHLTELVTSGFIQFGKVRYRTTEPKIFKFFQLEVEPLNGSIAADAILPNDTTNRFRLWDVQGTAELEQAALPASLGPQRSMGFKLTLTRASDPTKGPVIHSYAVKSLPAVKPQRLIQLPLMCYDREMWRTGQEWGNDGWSRDRLAALQAIEDSGDLVNWQDFSSADATGRQVRIDKVTFQQISPPADPKPKIGYGGVVVLILRSMD
jgi:hypothetical protein